MIGVSQHMRKEPLEFSQDQIIQALYEYSERRGYKISSLVLIAQGATSKVPDVKQITAQALATRIET